jgi:hypothetical protein
VPLLFLPLAVRSELRTSIVGGTTATSLYGPTAGGVRAEVQLAVLRWDELVVLMLLLAWVPFGLGGMAYENAQRLQRHQEWASLRLD